MAGGTSFEIVSDGADGCKKKAPPETFLGKGGQQVQWTVTNNCGLDVTVRLERFVIKSGTGPDPWQRPPLETSVGPAQTKVITGVLKPSSDVPPGNRGRRNDYTYVVTLVIDGRAVDTDPEIIIEWP